ncbi:MAG: Spy/CpxP family protein refolding chaperone [Candidatus Methylomirabilales bacterium]
MLIGAIGGSGVVLARAQQAPAPASMCTRAERLLTNDDREAIAKVFRNRIKEKLGLTDQQAEQIRSVLQSRRDEARADAQALCEARVELRRLLEQQNSASADLKAAAYRVKSLQGKFLDQRLDTVVALRSQLTPDQWAKWNELHKTMGHGWMGRGRGFAL